MRYSEDLDYVRTTAGGVGPLFDAIRDAADDLGFDAVRTAVTQHPKVVMRTRSTTGTPLRVKVEAMTAPLRPTHAERVCVTWIDTNDVARQADSNHRFSSHCDASLDLSGHDLNGPNVPGSTLETRPRDV